MPVLLTIFSNLFVPNVYALVKLVRQLACASETKSQILASSWKVVKQAVTEGGLVKFHNHNPLYEVNDLSMT